MERRVPEEIFRSCSTFFVATDRNGNMPFHLHDDKIFPAISNVLWAGAHWLTCKISVVVKMAERREGEKRWGCNKTPKRMMMDVHLDIFNTIPNCGCNKLLQFKHFVCFFTGLSLDAWTMGGLSRKTSCQSLAKAEAWIRKRESYNEKGHIQQNCQWVQ